MSRRRGSGSIAANPVLIGAATVLVVIVAVFLAYNANNGLPFVPSYELKAEVPSAANLVKGNEVRVGGDRVGTVTDIAPRQHRNGAVTAILTLKLQQSIKPLPRDSTLIVRPRSALGLKFVEITEGARQTRSGAKAPGFRDGDTIPVRQASPRPVEIDEVLNTFDKPTRVASRENLLEFGNALAGRGRDLNLAIGDLNPLFQTLIPVARNLADPQTGLGNFFRSLERAASIVAPVAEQQAQFFVAFDRTFSALARVARPFIQESISRGPRALDAAVRSFRVQRPFLLNSQHFFAELRPGVHALRGAAPILASALEIGTPVLRQSVALNNRLKPFFGALDRFSSDPLVPVGLRDLASTARILRPTIADLTPLQTTCNYISLWFRNVSSLLSEGDSNGTWQRFIIVATPQGPNNEGGPSSGPAKGPNQDNYLHSNPYPNTAQPGGANECEAANEPFARGKLVTSNPPGNQGTTHDTSKRSLTQ